MTSYRDATTNSTKRQSYEAVNSYQKQVDKTIADLQNKKQIINASLTELVQAKNEEKLNLVYDKIKQDSEVYQNDNKKIIDNHEQRTRAAIEIENKSEISEIEKNLAVQLRFIINGDSEQKKLENLAKELREFRTSSESQKKITYSNYSQHIDLMLTEVESELARREKSKKDREKTPAYKKVSPENKKSTIPLVVIIAGISILLVALSLYLVSRHRRKNWKRRKNKRN